MTFRAIKESLDHILSIVSESCDADGCKIPLKAIHALTAIFGNDAASAVHLVESEKVYLLETDEHRQVFKVESEEGREDYYCLKHSFYCTCPQYQYRGILSKETLLCKHILATRLAEAMKIITYRYIDDEAFVAILTNVASRKELQDGQNNNNVNIWVNKTK
ncbi:Zinc finger SWIM domain-containing protein 7 [Halotydeus destructor]|nr:Zinc finger SWIM domain-containing protein 7 [Halotydeus destructor]